MKLADFKRSGRADRTRFVAPVADTSGAENFELVLAGSPKLVQQLFGESDLETTIDSAAAFESSEEALREFKQLELEAYEEVASLERLDAFFKKPPPQPTMKNTVFASLHRVRGEGTAWSFTVSNLTFPTGMILAFLYPPVCTCGATIAPASGDQDLFLFRQFVFGPPVLRSLSVRGGTAVDAVSDSNPPLTPCNLFTHFIDLLHVFWFAAGTARTLTIRGFS